MNTLIIDASTDACSIALNANGQTSSFHSVQAKRHNDLLLPAINDCADECGIKLTELDLVVFGNGPGSFTGCRLAAATAKGIATAANAEIKSLSSFQLQAQGILNLFKFERVIIAQDARKGEIYIGAFAKDGEMMKAVTPPQLMKPSDVSTPTSEEWHASGDAWFQLSDEMPKQDNIIFERNCENWLPRAEDGFTLIDHDQCEAPDIAYLRPATDWQKWDGKGK